MDFCLELKESSYDNDTTNLSEISKGFRRDTTKTKDLLSSYFSFLFHCFLFFSRFDLLLEENR